MRIVESCPAIRDWHWCLETSGSLILTLLVLVDGECRNVFPPVSDRGCLTCGSPDLRTVFMEVVWRMTMYMPHFWLRYVYGGGERLPNCVAGVFELATPFFELIGVM